MAGSGQGGRLSAAMALERGFFWDGAVFQQVCSVEVLFLLLFAASWALVLGPGIGFDTFLFTSEAWPPRS